MKTNRFLAYAILLLCILSGSVSLLVAQDATEGAEGEEIVEVAEIEEVAEEEEQKESTARRFALFLEAGGGAMSVDDIESSIRNNSTFSSSTTVSFSDFEYGQATIGWQLPNDKGRFEATYRGHREDSYRLNAQGLYSILPEESDIGFNALPRIQWWTMEIADGPLHSEMSVPVWFADQNDTNGDGSVDLDEIIYPDTPAVVINNPASTDMQNSVQTYDVAYRRWFGNRQYGGVWSAGLRYLEYGGNVPATFWISADNGEFGWTTGGFQNPLIFTQNTTGIGPTASLGFEIKYFRGRLLLFGEGRLSFLLQTMETNSGDFFALLQDPAVGSDTLLSIPAEISSEFDKDVWNVSAEAGVRVQLLSGLFFDLAYTINSYHDVVLLPTQITIPDVLARIEQPVGGVFRSQDLVYSGVRSSLSFQF